MMIIMTMMAKMTKMTMMTKMAKMMIVMLIWATDFLRRLHRAVSPDFESVLSDISDAIKCCKILWKQYIYCR